MNRAPHAAYDFFRHEMAESLAAAGSSQRAHRQADIAAALLIAVGERYSGRDGCGPLPLCSREELRSAAEAATLPGGRQVAVSRAELDWLLGRPAMIEDTLLGPFGAATVRALGQLMTKAGMAPSSVLYPVLRTNEYRAVRLARANRAEAPPPDSVAFVGGGLENGGTGVVFSTCLDRDPAGSATQRFGRGANATVGADDDSSADAQVRRRVSRIAAIRGELLPFIGPDVLTLFRAERRFTDAADGCVTAKELWSIAQEPGWKRHLDALMPNGVVLVEVSREWLRGCVYEHDGAVRRLSTLSNFFSDIERRDPSVGAWSLLMSERKRDEKLPAPDDVTVLDGRLRMPDGEWVTLVVVTGLAASTVYAMPVERARTLDDARWDAVRTGLASVYGSAAVHSSDDQGKGLTQPYLHGLSVTDANSDAASNLDSLRFFSHAVETSRHWRTGRGRVHAPAPDRHRRAG